MTINDLETLSIFTEQSGIYGGANTANFKNIELWIQSIKNYSFNGSFCKKTPNALGLFGPASTGKTTTSKLVADALGYPFVSINAAALDQMFMWESIYNHVRQIHPDKLVHDAITYDFPVNGNRKAYIIQHCVVLLDECHELTHKTQAQLLSVLDGSVTTVNNAIQKTYPLTLNNVTWIFSTTDSGKLLYSLSTRLYPVIFNEYSEEDIVKIITLNYPMIPDIAALVLGRTSKLVPRMALTIAKQYITLYDKDSYTRETALEYSAKVRQVDEYGLDNVDKAILSFLKLSKTTIKGVNQYKPRSRQDISTYCRLLDMPDLEIRLGYLEKLGAVNKTKSGIQLKEDLQYDAIE